MTPDLITCSRTCLFFPLISFVGVVGYINFKSQKLSLIRKIRYQLAWDTTRFLPSVEMTASFVIPNECEESRFMLKIS
ncbi:hypothetical protein AUK22_07450 [bacterium CG2_30_54_10]|nr:MAG: hypothetical protein AUK22_07450 [bacterium CG2_30_54_10]